MANFRTSPFSNIPLVVKNLLILNALMLLATLLLKSPSFMRPMGLGDGYDLREILGLYYPGSVHFKPYQIITHLFMHNDFWHLFFNMFALWMFGTIIESVWGPKRFFIYYMTVGVAASAFFMAVNAIEISIVTSGANEVLNTGSPDVFMHVLKSHFSSEYHRMLGSDAMTAWYNDPHNMIYAKQGYDYLLTGISSMQNISVIGASGAVYGVLLAFGMMFPNEKIYIYMLIPLKAKYFVIIFGLLEVVLSFAEPGSSVAHLAHVGGIIFGFLLIKYWNRKKSNYF